jgi:adenylate cyclase
VWVGNYREEKSQILNLYNRITKQIADQVSIELTPDEESLLAESRTIDPEAYDAYLKGEFHRDRTTIEDLIKAKEYFLVAIEKESDWAPPYAGMAEVWRLLEQITGISSDSALQKRNEYINKAIELDPNSAYAYYLKGSNAYLIEWNWKEAELEFKRALELNPGMSECRMWYASLMLILHRTDEAIFQANLALELDPLRPFIMGFYGNIMRAVRDYPAAKAQYQKALTIDPNSYMARIGMGFYYRASGEYEKWFEVWKANSYWDEEVVLSIEKVFMEQGYLAAVEAMINFVEEVRMNGGNITEMMQATRYLWVKEFDKALDYFELAVEMHQPLASNISMYYTHFPELKDNPRYIALLKKMNLPLPPLK